MESRLAGMCLRRYHWVYRCQGSPKSGNRWIFHWIPLITRPNRITNLIRFRLIRHIALFRIRLLCRTTRWKGLGWRRCHRRSWSWISRSRLLVVTGRVSHNYWSITTRSSFLICPMWRSLSWLISGRHQVGMIRTFGCWWGGAGRGRLTTSRSCYYMV
jgi:hypothetical protein